MFIIIILVSVFVAFCFPIRMGISRKDVLEWLVPLFVGATIVSPFLAQVVPIYLNLNSAVFTGGLPNIQKALLSTRLQPLDIVLPFFICFFLFLVFSKYGFGKRIQFSTVLLVLWLIIPTALTQSFLVGLYTDYQRFLYFADLPLIIVVGLGIFLGARLLSKGTCWFVSVVRRINQKRFGFNKIPRHVSTLLSNQTTVAVFATALILVPFFELPHFFVTPSEGFQSQAYLSGHEQAWL